MELEVISCKLDKKLKMSFDAICLESGVSKNIALTKIIQYLTRPDNIQSVKSIIT